MEAVEIIVAVSRRLTKIRRTEAAIARWGYSARMAREWREFGAECKARAECLGQVNRILVLKRGHMHSSLRSDVDCGDE